MLKVGQMYADARESVLKGQTERGPNRYPCVRALGLALPLRKILGSVLPLFCRPFNPLRMMKVRFSK